MANRIEYPTPTTFRLVIDDFVGLNTESDPLALSSGEFTLFSNAVLNVPGPMQIRGGIPKCNTTDFYASNAGPMRFYDGPLANANVAMQPYYGIGANLLCYYQTSTTAASSTGYTHSTISGSAVPKGRSVLVGERLVQGFANGTTPDKVLQFAGTTHAAYSTGTATFTTGSTTVTLSDSLTAQQQIDYVGSFIVNTQDASPFTYRIASIESATSLTIDRAYAGSRSASASTFTITPVYAYKIDPTAGHAVGGTAVAAIAFSAWSRQCFACTTTGSSSAAGNIRKTYIVWSGLVGSTEGSLAPFQGMYGFDPNGYLELPSAGGAVIGVEQFGSAVLVFRETAITVLYGSPTFDSAGSLDASTAYTDFRPVGHMGAINSPMGVFFIDKTKGVCLWNGSGPPRPVNMFPVYTLFRTLAPDSIGYHRDHVIVSKIGGSEYPLMLHVPSGRWSRLVTTTGVGSIPYMGDYMYGRSDGTAGTGTHYLVARSGNTMLRVSNAIENPGDTEIDGASTYPSIGFSSGYFGDPGVLYRPENVSMSYRLEQAGAANGAYLYLTISTGALTGISSLDTTGATDFPQIGTGNAMTKSTTLGGTLVAAEQIRVTLNHANTGGGKATVYRIVITGTVEGEVPYTS